MADDGEDTLCLEILLQQSDSISRKNKLFVSSSKPVFQENSIKTAFSSSPKSMEQIYYNSLVTLNLHLFTSISVKFGRKDTFNKRIVSTTVCCKRKVNASVYQKEMYSIMYTQGKMHLYV